MFSQFGSTCWAQLDNQGAIPPANFFDLELVPKAERTSEDLQPNGWQIDSGPSSSSIDKLQFSPLPPIDTPVGQSNPPIPPNEPLRIAWWARPVSDSFRPNAATIPVELDMLFALTAKHSGRVLAVAQTPWVNETQIAQAMAAFDPTHFSDTRFDSTSDPVENTLTTGGPLRLEDNILGVDTGFRGETQKGGNYRIGQQIGHKNSNSLFFLPNNQGSSRLYANFTQPLMRGRHINLNRSLVLTAQFDTQKAQAEFQEALQNQFFKVAEAYWSLYYERASLLQNLQHLGRAKEIANLLEFRKDHDTSRLQVLRARAAVTNRVAEIAQSETRIRNLETRLRALINAPELLADRNAEFLPVQPALLKPIEFDIENQVAIALQSRPELSQLASKMNSLQVRYQLANDQTKPTLNMVAESYLAGRQGDSDIIGAFSDQFSEGRPGYAVGLTYELPVGNRAARASVRQRQFEVSQLNHLIDEASENIRAEVESAVRSVKAAELAANSRQVSLQAANFEVDALMDRWKTLGNDPRLGQLQLNELLNGQDRLLLEEQNLLEALVQYNRALLEVQRATGALIRFSN
jgi:outer membrane protein TolC